MDKSYYFYVLYCQDGSLYGGFTTDLAQREASHNAGKGAKYTRVKSRQPVRMIYAERFGTKPAAMKAEYQFKQLSRSAKEAYLMAQGQGDIQGGPLVLVNRKEASEDDASAEL